MSKAALHSRLAFYWKCINPLFKALAAAYAMLAALTWTRDELFPPGWGRYHVLYFLHLLPDWPWFLWLAIGLLILAIALVEGAFRERHLLSEASRSRGRLIDASGAVWLGRNDGGKFSTKRVALPALVVIAILALLKIYGHPRPRIVSTASIDERLDPVPPSAQTSQDRLTLLKLFWDENGSSLAVHRQLTLDIPPPGRTDKTNAVTIKCQVAADFDFNARAKYLSVYVPSSPESFTVCRYFCADYMRVFQDIEDSTTPSRTTGNDPLSRVPAKEMVFTGRVFIYHEDELSFEQIYALTHTCSTHGAALQLKGPDYLRLKMLSKQE